MKRVLAGAVLLVMLTGCGGGGDDKKASDTTAPAPSTTATTVFDAEKAKADIAAVYTKLFNESTPVDEQVALLEHGEDYRDAINQQKASGSSKGVSVSVKSVQPSSPVLADVTFDILLNGAVVAANTKGQAKWIDGSWKVNERLFCTLLNLGNIHPDRCEQVLSAP
jgi:hypothetical protein